MKLNRVIGLTGQSGSGKSTVAAALREEGAFVIDCDKIAHENMTKDGIAYKDIVAAFGSGILGPNGEIDRKRLGAMVFSDKASLERLNALTHGHIIKRVKEQLRASKGEVTVIDAPLLQETGLDSLCDEVWITEAPYEVRLSRIMERDGITLKEAESRLKSQTPPKEGENVRHIATSFETVEELHSFIKELI